MSSAASAILYHAPNSRSATVRWMLEEIGQPYELRVLDFAKGEHKTAAYLAVNPMGKVPCLEHNGGIITETAAILTYLADAFPGAGLAPPIGDPKRGPYLRWMFFGPAAWEPAIVDHAMKRSAGDSGSSPYGSYEAVITTLEKGLEQGPYLVGDTFTAADLFFGASLAWTMGWKLVPEKPAFLRLVSMIAERPARKRQQALDAALSEKMKA